MKAILFTLTLLFPFFAAQGSENWNPVPQEELVNVQRSLQLSFQRTQFHNCQLQMNDGWVNMFERGSNRYISFIYADIPSYKNKYGQEWLTELSRNGNDGEQPVLRSISETTDGMNTLVSYLFTNEAGTRIDRVESTLSSCFEKNTGTIANPNYEVVCEENFSLTCIAR